MDTGWSGPGWCNGVMNDQELARRCAEVMYAGDRATRHLGITIDAVAPGRATARMPVTDTMINGHDLCHGGYLLRRHADRHRDRTDAAWPYRRL